jgi:hypothetical protein
VWWWMGGSACLLGAPANCWLEHPVSSLKAQSAGVQHLDAVR